MVAIRVIFDGKNFVPQQPVTMPDRAEAVVWVEHPDPQAVAQLDADVRAYYQAQAEDDEDHDWRPVADDAIRTVWDKD